MKNQRAAYYPWPLPAPSPAHRKPAVQHETNVSRAYRLGKSETLCDLHSLLVDENYTARDLQQEIVSRMHDLCRLDRNAILGARHAQEYQECQGLADACICCFNMIATQKLYGYTLSNSIADRLFATWPPDYLEYLRRYEDCADQDLELEDKVACLDLRQWYDAVDALNYELERIAATGLPPSDDRPPFAALLLDTASERIPCAE